MVLAATEPMDLDPDAACVAHLGAIAVDIRQGQPLPEDAVCWSWEDEPEWYEPGLWPWCVYEPGEAYRLRQEAVAEAQKACFDETGRVEKVKPFEWPERPERPIAPQRELPPGFQIEG